MLLMDAGHQPGGGHGHVDDCGAVRLCGCEPAVLLPVPVCEARGALRGHGYGGAVQVGIRQRRGSGRGAGRCEGLEQRAARVRARVDGQGSTRVTHTRDKGKTRQGLGGMREGGRTTSAPLWCAAVYVGCLCAHGGD